MAVLRWLVAKRATATGFFVELTDYGWSVRAGTVRLGLFVTQRQALKDVKTRRDELTAKGQKSTLVVTGDELSQPTGISVLTESSLRRRRASPNKTPSARRSGGGRCVQAAEKQGVSGTGGPARRPWRSLACAQ